MNDREQTFQSLESLCQLIVDCPHATPAWTSSGYVVLRNQNIKAGRLDLSAPSFTDEDHFLSRTRRARPMQQDIVITREAPMGDVCMVPEGLQCCLGQRQVLLRPDTDAVDPRYLLFALQSPMIQRQIAWNEGTGSTVSNLRIPVLKALRVPAPNLLAQRAIGDMLGALDDRIELLRETNATLEAIAQALFKSWFVDFDPVKAKSEGRAPEGMDAATAALFPDSFEDSALGRVPRGWRCTQFGTEFEVVMGQSPRGEFLGKDLLGMPFYQGRRDFGFRFPSARVFCTSPTRLAMDGDVLVSVRAPVGDVNVAVEKCCIGRGVAAVRPRSLNRSFTLHLTRSLGEQFAIHNSEGTVFGSLSKGDFNGIKVVMPPSDLENQFESVIGPLDSLILNAEMTLRSLASIRDALLPRLISGRLRVGDAEDEVAAALEASEVS